MKIFFDIEFDQKGNPFAWHFLDTSDPAVIATLQNCSNNPAAQLAAGYSVPTKIPGHPVGTPRWQVVITEANKPTADAAVKTLGLK